MNSERARLALTALERDQVPLDRALALIASCEQDDADPLRRAHHLLDRRRASRARHLRLRDLPLISATHPKELTP